MPNESFNFEDYKKLKPSKIPKPIEETVHEGGLVTEEWWTCTSCGKINNRKNTSCANPECSGNKPYSITKNQS
ncbi:MAG: hypothetical protein M3Q34_02505 [bacterium]|nr:hypothetical protein [bacterium]